MGKDFTANSYATLTVPSGWGTPTTGNTVAAGGTCGTVSRTTSSQTITVTMTSGCTHGNSFTLTYSPVTAPSTLVTGTFNSGSHIGSGGTATAPTAGNPQVSTVAGPAAKLAFTTSPPSTNQAGASFGATVQVQDAVGNLVNSSTAPVTVAIGNNPGSSTLSGTATVNAVAGIATFSGLSLNKIGTAYTLVASSASLTSGTSAGFNITAGTATQLGITSINGGSTPTAYTSFNVVIQSQDSQGNPSNVGVLTQVSLLAQGNGIANASGSIPAGSNTITLSLTYSNNADSYPETGIPLSATRTSGTPLTPANTTFTVNPPVCTTFDFLNAPTTVGAGGVTGAFTVEAESPFGNFCSITAPVSLTQGTSTGTFYSDAAGTIPVTSVPFTAGSGAAVPGPHQATFYYRDTVAGPHTLSVGSTGMTSNSAPLTVTAGPPAKLAFSTVPATASADNTFSVTVQSQDTFGNVSNVSGATAVTLSLASGAGPLGGTLLGSIPAGQSTATFSGLSDHLVESITLSATDTSGAITPLTTATSSAITITPGAATHTAFVQQPSDANGGAAIAPTVTVQLLDQFDNRAASSANVTLTFGNNAGSGVLSGASVSASNGLASFPALAIDKAGTGYTLVATSGALAVGHQQPVQHQRRTCGQARRGPAAHQLGCRCCRQPRDHRPDPGRRR